MIPKFRAWDKVTDLMNEVTVIDFESEEVYYHHWRYGHSETINLKDIELLQSTGLKDKNGVEMFEGDVLKVFVLDNKGPHAKVIFKNGMFGIEDDMFGYGYDKGLYSLDQILSIRDAEIIGNIYEHPHLLEE